MFFQEISFVVSRGKPWRRSISQLWLKVESVSTPVRLGLRVPFVEHFADEVEVLLHVGW